MVPQGRGQGYPQAEHSLGILYEFGTGVPADPATAAQWYRKAAEQGFAPAQFSLGLLYVHGQGVPKDEARSFDLLRQAAEAGSADAQFQLGMDYYQGEEGLQPDNDLARKWLHRSAQQGDVAAMFNYAMLLKA